MTKRLRYTISFLPNDQELIDFIQNKRKNQSFSSFVRELIRREMETGVNKDELETIYQYVIKRLHENSKIEIIESKKDSIDDIDKDIIINLF